MPKIGKGLYRQKSQTERKCQKCGDAINKGDLYILYEPRHSVPRVRCNKSSCMLRASEMTSSSYLSSLYGAQESISDAVQSRNIDNILQALEDAMSAAEETGEEAQSSLDSMPEALQESSSSGETLQGYIDSCESWRDDLETAKDTVEELVSEVEELVAELEATKEAVSEAEGNEAVETEVATVQTEEHRSIEEIEQDIEDKTEEAGTVAEEASGNLDV